VDAIVGEDVWVYYREGKYAPAHHLSWTKTSIDNCKWRIREEWVDVTDECTFEERGYIDGVWIVVVHDGYLVTPVHGNYMIKNNGIYKRRTT